MVFLGFLRKNILENIKTSDVPSIPYQNIRIFNIFIVVMAHGSQKIKYISEENKRLLELSLELKTCYNVEYGR